MVKIKHKTNKSKAVCKSCGNNKSCSYCRGNRLHNSNKKIKETEEQIKENN